MNGVKDGVPNAPPYPPHSVDGVHHAPTPMSVHVDESPPTKFVFQAKIEAIRYRHETSPFNLKPSLIELLVKHQRLDPTFHLLPTEEGSTAGAITKAADLPNTERRMKEYVKEKHEIDSRNSPQYTVIFFIKVASSMTLGMMKQDKRLFDWLRDKKLFILAFHFTMTYDVATAGFISQMHGGIHNRDKMNKILQTAMKHMFPEIEVKMVPTAFRHGNQDNKRTTQVVSIQADRKQLNEAREALVQVFQHSAAQMPNDIFFVPAPTNGMMSTEMYYNLVNAHDASMSNMRSSFAITGIANLQAQIDIQSNTDPNSSNKVTIEESIMGAKVNGTDTNLFTSIEPTSKSQTEGRFLLLTKKHLIGKAEYMIDTLIEHISTNPVIKKETNIAGMEIKRANKYNGSSNLKGHLSFLEKHLTTEEVLQNTHNAWNKRCAQTSPTYYSPDKFPALPSSKAARTETTDNPSSPNAPTDNEMNDDILIDFEAEMKKEREHSEMRLMEVEAKAKANSESRLAEMEAAFTKRCEQLEMKFMDALSETKQETESMMQKYLGNMISKADAINDNIDSKLAQHSKMMPQQMAILLANPNGGDDTNDPPRKYQCIQNDGTPMEEVTHIPTTTPASPQNLFQNGKDARGQRK
jgi:hypothetical protein